VSVPARIAERACADFFYRDRVTGELGRQRLASCRASELGDTKARL